MVGPLQAAVAGKVCKTLGLLFKDGRMMLQGPPAANHCSSYGLHLGFHLVKVAFAQASPEAAADVVEPQRLVPPSGQLSRAQCWWHCLRCNSQESPADEQNEVDVLRRLVEVGKAHADRNEHLKIFLGHLVLQQELAGLRAVAKTGR